MVRIVGDGDFPEALLAQANANGEPSEATTADGDAAAAAAEASQSAHGVLDADVVLPAGPVLLGGPIDPSWTKQRALAVLGIAGEADGASGEDAHQVDGPAAGETAGAGQDQEVCLDRNVCQHPDVPLTLALHPAPRTPQMQMEEVDTDPMTLVTLPLSERMVCETRPLVAVSGPLAEGQAFPGFDGVTQHARLVIAAVPLAHQGQQPHVAAAALLRSGTAVMRLPSAFAPRPKTPEAEPEAKGKKTSARKKK